MFQIFDLPIIPADIKPNTLMFHDSSRRLPVYYGLNQLFTNGSFENDLTGWVANAGVANIVNDGVQGTKALEIVGTNTSYPGRYQTLNVISGHKYYFCGYFKRVSGSLNGYFGVMGGSILAGSVTFTESTYTFKSFSATSGQSGNANILILGANAANVTQTIRADAVMAFDLTAIFGTGNEPTAIEMDSILTADNTPYWDGTRQVLCNPGGKYYWYDFTGNGRHMKLNNLAYSGASGWQNDPYRASFDGVDDHGCIVNDSGVDVTTAPLAIFATVRVASGAGTGFIVCKDTSAFADVQYGMFWDGATKRIVSVLEGANRALGVSNTVLEGVWCDVGFIWDGTNTKTYVNAVQSGASVAYSSSLTSRPYLRIGRRETASSHFKGDIRNDAIYSGAGLTEAKVLNHRRQVMRRLGIA